MDIPADYHGVSYRQAIDQSSFKPRTEIIGKINQIRSDEDMMGKKVEAYWLRNQEWFFKWNLTLDQMALYDMNTDPENNHDVSHQKMELVQDLKNSILAWKEKRK